MASAFEFILNGRSVRVADVSPNTTLLEYLRAHGLTGSKEGCAEGDCGACSVAMIERDSNGKPTWRAVNSCLMPVCLVAGRELVTVEGIGNYALHAQHSALDRLHPVQRKMVEHFGSQCGYCTPGFVCSLFEGYYRDDLSTQDDLDDQLSGNLCRCTGYRAIREAAIDAFSCRSSRGDEAQTNDGNRPAASRANGHPDSFVERLKQTRSPLGSADYRSNGEQFFRPTSLVELLQLRNGHPDARLIAGATELGLDITKRFKKFPVLISSEGVVELKELKSTETEWHIGAAVTLTDIEDELAAEYPAFADMLRVFGSRQIRNRATMGGNIVTASPIGDSAPVLLALDAKVALASESGERTLPISEFFIAYRKTALQPGEILKTIIIPRGSSMPGLTRQCRWFKVSKRREMDISTVAACFTVDLDAQGIVRHVRLAYGGVAAMPLRARKTETALLGKVWNQEAVQSALPILRAEFAPISDVRGTAEYRSGLIASLLEKFYAECSWRPASLPAVEDGILPPGEPLALNSDAGGSTASLQTAANSAGLGSPALQQAGKPAATPHESAHKHVTGEAMYVDDQTLGMLEVWPVCSPHARAKILKRDATAARQMPGIRTILFAEDIPGANDVGTKKDEPLLASNEVLFHSQFVALVVGETQETCRAAAEKVVVEYDPLKPIVTLRDAIAAKSVHNEPNFIRRGNCDETLSQAPLSLEGEFELQGQEHFYLETHAAWAERGEDGSIFVASSTQHPSEVQQVVAHLLHLPANKVVVQVSRMGGGFGGKETQAATPAGLAALAAYHVAGSAGVSPAGRQRSRAVRVRFNRDQDMAFLGHRHPFLAKFKVGFDENGLLQAAQVHLWSNGGWAQDLSQAVTDRALFHLDNAYYIPAVEFRGQVAKTNLSSNTAFRGFGGPQGMLVIEEILDRIARRLGLPPEVVRERNLYRGTGETNTTHYGQQIEDNRIQTIWQELKKSAELEQRRAQIAEWNAGHPHVKRGIAITPVKFGISFTVTHLNQAGAFVLIYQDGTVQLNHGGTEMGQGLHTNVVMIAARELGVKLENIRVMPTSTDKVPNTSATAASAGTDLNGMAVKNACETLRTRLAPVALELVAAEVTRLRANAEGGMRSAELSQSLLTSAATEVIFDNGFVFHREFPEVKIPFAQVAQKAYLARVSLSATGYYATPGIHWERAAGRGKPFHYFAYGAAVTEVEVDGFTGMHRVLRVDILHDVGDSVNEGVNRGQIEGGFVQGMGWLTTEELKWDDKGTLLTHSPDTYKIPSIGDTPKVFNVTLLKNATQTGVIHGSKAVGEPPLMLAISVREALRDAVAAFGSGRREVPLASPATCEALWMAIQKQSQTNEQALQKAELAMAK
ncbi:MAG TPA: xanthine dehydrogenase molybdopterin binding subunit [Verrucomicrobiae bacterium]|nr:xanthine dehydrogenase molybdopterin binding subunit [Verrucomicrobiae bacterium]